MAANILTIGDMSRDFGISLRAIRFYENSGLLKPQRKGKVRYYDGSQQMRLRSILDLKRLGFTLKEIRSLLSSSSRVSDDLYVGARGVSADRLSASQLALQIAHLEQRLSDVNAGLAELRALQSARQASNSTTTTAR